MKRREFISLLAGAAATWPVAVRAQQGERVLASAGHDTRTLLSAMLVRNR